MQTIQLPAATAVFAREKVSFTNCRQRGTGSWRSTEYTIFNRIYFARVNIIFVEGNKFIASFETHFLFLSSVLKNYQEARNWRASCLKGNCWGASCFEPVAARHSGRYRKIKVLVCSHTVRLGYLWSELHCKSVSTLCKMCKNQLKKVGKVLLILLTPQDGNATWTCFDLFWAS